jgi:hypothetical protein
MLRSHLEGVLAWTRVHLDSRAPLHGTVEGMNISHRAFGFRHARNFIAAI